MIAALYVAKGGAYYGIEGVDPWDEARDARLYAGPWPVVAHPPCQRRGKFYAGQPLTIKKTGIRKKLGDDGGCFKHALETVRRVGGVIEHPWDSKAWPHFKLKVPEREGGWIVADEYGGWTCCVEQGRYGHYARKPTLLYVNGCKPWELPELLWGVSEAVFPAHVIAKHGLAYAKRAGELAFKGGGKDNKHRIGTPPAFREILLALVRQMPMKINMPWA